MPAEALLATLLFTDLVSSTALAQRVGDDAADDVRRIMFKLLRDAVAAAAGREVKSQGDGLMAVFHTPSDAVASAVAMQRAIDRHNRRHGRELGLRVGIHTGEVVQEEEDYFGTPVVVAQRLCSAATGGQILCSDVLRMLAGSRGGHVYQSVGSLGLKGITEPVAAFEVAWAPEADRPLPQTLSADPRTSFVGRTEELQALAKTWDEVRGGVPRVVLIAGEPGVGKTRLGSDFARRAHAAGASVLFGRSFEASIVPFQPFRESLAHLVAHCSDDVVASIPAAELSRLVPEVAERVRGVGAPARGDPESERFRLFEAVKDSLVAASSEAPVVVVLDDLHWADKPTLLMLVHVVRHLGDARVLFVGTYRETELDRAHPLSDALADLRRDESVTRIYLRGLDEAGVAELATQTAGRDVAPDVTHAIYRETDGNPFFVGEVLLHLMGSGALSERSSDSPDGLDPSYAVPDELFPAPARLVASVPIDHVAIPEGVKEVIGRRLSRLSEDANRILAIGAVVGREFSLRVLERVSERSYEHLVDAIEEAVNARLVAEVPGAIACFGFAHALVQETLYQELIAPRRALLHRRVAGALEELYGTEDEERVEQLAYHLLEAAQGEDMDRAIGYAQRAAARATQMTAYEDASLLYEKALHALALVGHGDETLRCDLLLALADTQFKSGAAHSCWDNASKALDIARTIGSAERMAIAAMTLAGPPEFVRVPDDDAANLEEALRGLARDSAFYAVTASRLACLLAGPIQNPDVERAEALKAEALDLATRLSEPQTIAYVLRAAMIVGLNGFDLDVQGRLEQADRIMALGKATRDEELLLYGHGYRGFLRYFVGDMAGADEDSDDAGPIVERLRQPNMTYWLRVFQSGRATMRGDLDEAERFANEALMLGLQNTFAYARGCYAVQLVGLRHYQGRLAELLPIMRAAMAENPVPAWRCALSWVCSELGFLDEARELFEGLAATEFRDLPLDGAWLNGVSRLSMACTKAGSRQHAATLRELLLPHAGRNVALYATCTCAGSSSRYLGMLEAMLALYGEAERHFREAIETNDRMGARPLIAHTKQEFAQMLLERDGPGDRTLACELLDDALRTAKEVGMPALTERIESLSP